MSAIPLCQRSASHSNDVSDNTTWKAQLLSVGKHTYFYTRYSAEVKLHLPFRKDYPSQGL
jgi:hypothetical protein